MSEAARDDRQQVIDGFVQRLVTIRTEAGEPSFRSMAKRSGAISHATLHDAVQGTRLPSWETTVEFAKTCGVDPETLRSDWDGAVAALNRNDEREAATPGVPDLAGEVTSVDGATVADRSGEGAQSSAERTTSAANDHFSGGPSRSAIIFGILGLVAGLIAGFFVLKLMNDSEADPAAAATTPAPTSSNPTAARSAVMSTGTGSCIENPPAHPSPKTNPKQLIRLMEDVTLKDCTEVARGKKLTKSWTFRNVGAQPLEGLRLKRIGPYRGPTLDCKTPEETPVKTIAPGKTVTVSMPFETATEKVDCFVRFMFVKRDGTYAFPYQQPIFVSVHVR